MRVHSKSLGDGSQSIEVWTDITKYEKDGGFLKIRGTMEWIDWQTWTHNTAGQEVLEWRSVIYRGRVDPIKSLGTTRPNEEKIYTPGSVIELEET